MRKKKKQACIYVLWENTTMHEICEISQFANFNLSSGDHQLINSVHFIIQKHISCSHLSQNYHIKLEISNFKGSLLERAAVFSASLQASLWLIIRVMRAEFGSHHAVDWKWAQVGTNQFVSYPPYKSCMYMAVERRWVCWCGCATHFRILRYEW